MKNTDLVGKKFGMLTVIEDSGLRKGSSVLWRCKCGCGCEILEVRHRLVSGMVQNCGCIPKSARPAVSDLVGRRFGKLTVVCDSGKRNGGGSIYWRCKCDCGGEILAVRSQLLGGVVESCGCVPKECATTGHAEDLTGRQFGELTVLRRAENDKNNRVCWLCRCGCGKEVKVPAMKLKSGHTRSCGCARHNPSYNRRSLTGQRFGRLIVLGESLEKDKPGTAFWHCRCDCGNEIDASAANLLCGLTKSCGCLNREQSAKMHERMHYQDNTCVERLERIYTDKAENKAGFRGLFLTKCGTYRVTIKFQGTLYNLGYFKTFDEAVRARLDAEEVLHAGYLKAFRQYEQMASRDPEWARSNPFYYKVTRENGRFSVATNCG